MTRRFVHQNRDTVRLLYLAEVIVITFALRVVMFTLLLLFGDFVLLDVICVDFVSSDVSLFGNVFGFVYKY